MDDACDDDDLVDVCSESLLLVKAVARAGAAEFALAGKNADDAVFLGADSRTVIFAVVVLIVVGMNVRALSQEGGHHEE